MAIAVTNDASAFKRSANAPGQTAYTLWGWFNFTTVTPARFWGPLGIYAGADGAPTTNTAYHQISSAASGSANLVLGYDGPAGAVTVALATVSTNTWYFMALTCSALTAGNLKAYIRAITANTLTVASSTNTADTFTPARTEWGRDAFTGDFITGSMHAIGSADVAKSVDELLEMSYFHEPQLDGISSLNCFYPCIESVNTNASVDRSGNARNATVTHGALADSPPLLWRAIPPPWNLPSSAASGDMTGSTSFAFTATGTLTGAGALSGATTLTFSPTATLIGNAPITGSSSFAFSPTATLTGSGALTGASTLTFAPTSTLTGTGALSGSSSFAFSPSSTLTGSGALSGTATVTFSPTGTLSDAAAGGAMAGASSFTFTIVGTLTGTGDLAGSTTLTFSPAGVLSDASAPAVVARSGGAGRSHRRRYTIRIDGQVFEAEDESEAVAILAQAQALAEKAATNRAEEIVERALPKALSLGAVKPIAIKSPTINVSNALAAEAQAAQAAIDRAYAHASAVAELRLLMALTEADDDEEDFLLLH